MPVVTISRQLGTQGRVTARLLAEILKYRFVWRELINLAAARAGAPEMALAAIDELGLLNICPDPKDCEAYHQAVRQVINELADGGNVVILGRAGQVILRASHDALHVRLTAPLEVRVERVAASQNISQAAALEQVKASDRYRKNYLKKFYDVRWDDLELYDLIINTKRLTPEQVARAIQAALLSKPETQNIEITQEPLR